MHQPTFRKYFPKPALTCLAVEIIVLIGAAFLSPAFPDTVLVMAISLVAAMQNSSFTRVQSWDYNSVMTTGNLRCFAEAFYKGIMPKIDRASLREAWIFGFICLCFLTGAVVAALISKMHDNGLFIPVGLLATAFIICWRRQKVKFTNFRFT
jgi:uncharacterized membrane protein YoaK (UPF0700 family)